MFNFINSFMDRHKKDLGLYLLIITFLLVTIGCIFVYSASSIAALVENGDVNYYFKKQIIFSVLGFIVLFIACNLNTRIYRKYFFYFYGIVMFLLILVHFIGVGAGEVGAKSWIRFLGIGIQPSELGKIIVIMSFSLFLEKGMFNLKKDVNKTIVCSLFVIIPIILVFFEPDLGSVAIMAAAIIAILFFTDIPIKYFLTTGILGTIFLSLFMTVRGYRVARIEAWLHPFKDPQGISYQIIQSFYAIANGGLLGQGIGNSKQKFLWLPEQHTDFIFSVIAEETGFWGALIILLLIISLFVITIYMSKFKKTLFEKYTIIGLGFILTFQSFINIMVATGIFPVTGITLPFISYGGSSIVISCLMIGIIFSMYYDYK